MKMLARLFFFCLLLGGVAFPAHAARDASFMAPNATTSSVGARGEGAVAVEPKSDIDLGETAINVGKRTTVFFVNTTNLPVEIVSITANGDSNVNAEIVADDCSKEGKIASASRCSVTVETTPKGSGQWTAEVLMTHNAAGRLARARLSGKTSGNGADKKDTGLSLSTKDVKPIDFGTLDIGGGKAVRSALMVNDSNEPITILSIEVIAAENGLEKLDQGCMMDMDLKPGESCPVTLVWKPEKPEGVSTDLIIRHSGRMGFSVIPIRGTAKDESAKNGKTAGDVAGTAAAKKGGKDGVPLSPTAEDLEKLIAAKPPQLSAEAVAASALASPEKDGGDKEKGDDSSDGAYHLIGTVGNRGVFYMPDGSTSVAGVGDMLGEGKKAAKIVEVMPKQAAIMIGDKRKVLTLEAVSALTAKAAEKQKEAKAAASKGGDAKKKEKDVPSFFPKGN